MSDAFGRCKETEQRALDLILPMLSASYREVIHLARGDQTAMEFQWRGIDLLLIKEPAGPATRETVAVELKAEERTTGNLFLETWSNRRTGREGWIRTSRAVGLIYCFLDTESIYVAHMGRLQEWATTQLHCYPERVQQKHSQSNETVGHIVPILRLSAEVGLRRFHVRANRQVAA